MDIEFDPAKDAINIVKHGVSLARACEMQITAFIEDSRRPYGETRYIAYGLIDGMHHCLVFTDRSKTLRAISLRRAHLKEYQRHVQDR